jgi:hypothetical protein
MQLRVTRSCVQDLIDLNKVVSTVRDFSGVEIHVVPIDVNNLEFVAWSDASFANAEEL